VTNWETPLMNMIVAMPGYDLAQGSLFNQAGNWSSIVSAVIAVLAVGLGFAVATTFYQKLALLNRRRRCIGAVTRDLGMHKSRVHFTRTCWQLLSDRIHSGNPQVREELIWLSRLNPVAQLEAGLPSSDPVPIPFTFAPHVVESGYASSLGRLSTAYDAYASSLRRRWLLRSTAGPLVNQEYGCARDTASLLGRWASFEPMPDPADPDEIRGRLIELAPSSRPRNVRLVTWPDMTASRAAPTFPIVGVSFQPYRVVMDGSPARKVRPDPQDIRVVANVLSAATSNPLSFDGVLPRWHGPGFRLEIDRITGRQKLHLCVAETTYFAFRATQLPEAADLAGDAAGCARVLTLNLLAVDEDDVILLTRRSDYVVQAGCFSGTISGNCELVSREGLDADLDAYGLPDLLGAILRETREELGLGLKPDSQLAALGVIEINSETELGTHVLVATTRLPGRAAGFKAKRSAPDPVEGLWEIGDELMTVNLGHALADRSVGRRLVAWLRNCQDLTPGGVGSILLLLIARLELRQQQAARSARNARPTSPPSWTTTDLSKWLDQPATGKQPDVADIVGSHPLWK
jgi:hypothetical protein